MFGEEIILINMFRKVFRVHLFYNTVIYIHNTMCFFPIQLFCKTPTMKSQSMHEASITIQYKHIFE